MSCPNCGASIPAGSPGCPNCGAGYGPPAGDLPPAVPARTYDLQGLATALTVMLAISALTALIGIAAGMILIITFLVSVPITIVFLIWFYRARQNAGHLDWRQRWSPGWAIGGWFVPVCFLWFPYQIMADIWRAGLAAENRKQLAYLPGAWWACWCLAWFTGYRRPPAGSGDSSATVAVHGSTFGLYFGGSAVSLVFGAAAAVLLALIVRRVSAGPVGTGLPGLSRRRAAQ